jgi:phage-related protein
VADERNVIEIILKARDETAAAFASVTAAMGLQKEMAKDLERENKNLEESYRSLGSGVERQKVTFDDLRGSFAKTRPELAENIKLTKDLARAYSDVERTTKTAVDAQDRRTHSLAQQAIAEKAAESAQKRLSKALRDQIKDIKDLDDEEKKYLISSATRHAASTRNANEAIALNQRRKRSIQEVADEDERAAKRSQQNASTVDRIRENLAKRNAQRARETLADIKREQAAESDSARQSARRADQEINDLRRGAQALRQYERDVQRVTEMKQKLKNEKLGGVEKMRVELDLKHALVQAKVLEAELNRFRDKKFDIDLNTAGAEAHLAEFRGIMDVATRTRHINIEADTGRAIASLGALEVAERSVSNSGGGMGSAISSGISTITSSLQNAEQNIAGFDNVLRGLATFAIVGFLQPLITVAGAAGGALVALGSAALYAGGALGGTFIAGIAQALPVLGVFAMLVSRLTAVFGAAKQAQLVDQQASYRGAAAHTRAAGATTAHGRAVNTLKNSQNSLSNATDGVRTAEENLTKAHQGVNTAEQNLSKSRQQARRDLQDMILTEKEAELQAKSAALAQKDARAALAHAISTGGDVAGAQLQVQESNLQAARAHQQVSRTSSDLAASQRQGIAGAPGVVSAQQQLDQAKRGVGDAERAVTRAQRAAEQARRGITQAGIAANQAAQQADLAGSKITAAGGKLDFLTGRLSGAERRLLDIVKRFQDVFRVASQTITEPLINAFGTAMNQVIQILQRPDVKKAMQDLAGEMAKQGLRFFNAFTDKKSINIFFEFIREAQKNLRPLTDILINLGKIFLDIGRAAAPSLSRLLKFFDQVTTSWLKFTGDANKQKGDKNPLRQFFHEGTDALLAFLRLGGAIAKLFLAIAGPGGGARTGIDLIKGATEPINKLADSINRGGKAAQFFHQLFRITGEVLSALKPVIVAIGTELGKTFSEKGVDSVKAFASILATIVIPAIGQFIRQVGGMVTQIGKFIDKHPQLAGLAKDFIGISLAIGIASKAAGLLVAPLSPLATGLDKIIGKYREMKKAKDAAETAQAAKAAGGAAAGAEGAAAAGAEGAAAVGAEGAGAAGLAAAAIPVAAVLAATGAIVGLLAVTGNLKPVLKALSDGFHDIIKVAGPPFRNLINQVKDLFSAFEKGKGVMVIVRPIVTFFTGIFIRAIKGAATYIGNVLGGAFKVLGGIVEILTGILTLNFGKIWNGVKKVFGGLAQIATAGIKGFLAILGDLPGKALHIFVSVVTAIAKFMNPLHFIPWGLHIINGFFRGLANLQNRFENLIAHVIVAVLKFFNPVHFIPWGLHIISGLLNGLKGLADRFGGVIARALAVAANFLRPDHFIPWGLHIISGLLSGLGGLGGKLFDKITGAFGDIFKWITTKLPGKLGDLLDTAMNTVVQGIKKLPKLAWDTIKDAAKSIPGAGIVTKIFSLIQEGGPIGKGYGGGDRIPALLEEGEHVLTKEEVQAAGGHDVIFAFRRALGGGTQSRGGRFQGGGAAGASVVGASNIDFSSITKEIKRFVSIFTNLWGDMWQAISNITNAGQHRVQNVVHDMTTGIRSAIRAMSKAVTNSFDDMRDSANKITDQLAKHVSFQMYWTRDAAKNAANQLFNSVKGSFQNLDNAVWKGINYVAQATNKGLKTFNAKPVDISVDKPPGLAQGGFAGKAGGGFVGRAGERGRDAVNILVGRGEAVLNWAHQRYVDPALREVYGFGLDEMFHRVRGEHGRNGQPTHVEGGYRPRYAAGGYVYPFGSGFGRGRTDMGLDMTGQGPIAVVGDATFTRVDPPGSHTGWPLHSAGDGVGAMIVYRLESGPFKGKYIYLAENVTPKTGLSAGAKLKAGEVFAQGHNQFAFLEMGWAADARGTTLASATTGYTEGEQTAAGKDFTNFIFGLAHGKLTGGGQFGGAISVATWDKIKDLVVHGTGALKDLAEAAIKKVTEAANKYGEDKAGTSTDGTVGIGNLSGPTGHQIFQVLTRAGYNKIAAAGIIGNAYAESGLNPSAMEPGTDNGGLWGFTAHPVALSDVRAFAARMKKPWNDPGVQTAFLVSILARDYPSLKGTMNAMKDPGDAASYFMNTFERPGVPREDVRRGGAATAFRAGYAQGGWVGDKPPTPSGGEYAVGGEIPGSAGQPIPILAHAREWVLNQTQQQKVANWIGTSRNRLKGALGFTGGPTSFAGGGEISLREVEADIKGLGRIPILSLFGIQKSFEDEIKKLEKGGVKEGEKELHDALERFVKSVDFNISIASTHRVSVALRGLERQLRALARTGLDTKDEKKRYDELQKQHEDLLDAMLSVNVDLVGQIVPGGVNATLRLIRRVNTAFKFIGQGFDRNATKTENAITQVERFTKGIETLTGDDGYFARLAQVIDERTTQLQTRLQLAQTGLRERRGPRGARDATRLVRRRPLTEIQDITQDIRDTNVLINELGKERNRLRTDLIATNRQLAGLRKGGITSDEKKIYERLLAARNKLLQDMDDTDAKIAAARQDRFEKTQTKFTDQLNAQLRQADINVRFPSNIRGKVAGVLGKVATNMIGKALSPDTVSRIGQALGRTDLINAATTGQLEDLKARRKVIERKLKEAQAKAKHDPRWQQTVDDLNTQLQDTVATIVETQAQQLQNTVDQINQRAQRRQTGLDLFNRIADLQERAGGAVAAGQTRLAVLRGTGASLVQQRDALARALQTATLQKNTGQMEALHDQIADLGVQIAENTAAISDQIVAIRQSSIDLIQSRAQFQTGIFGGLGQLAQTIATNLTTDTSQQQLQFLAQNAAALQQQASGLAQQLLGGYGVNLTGLSGLGFARTVSGLNFDRIEAGMTQAQKGQFESLIQALIDSQNAIESNTSQINELNGNLGKAQSFSSTAWQWYRMAVFTGAGGLLPQYQIPSMQTGGFVRKSGIFNLEAGEFVVNPARGQSPGGITNHITVHESGPETDYTYLANRIAFASRVPST